MCTAECNPKGRGGGGGSKLEQCFDRTLNERLRRLCKKYRDSKERDVARNNYTVTTKLALLILLVKKSTNMCEIPMSMKSWGQFRRHVFMVLNYTIQTDK